MVVGDNDDDGVAVSVNTLTANGGTIRDAAGNNAVLAHDAIAADVANRVDTIIPSVATATINGVALTLTYSEVLDTSSVPASTDYTLALESGTAPTVNPGGVAISPDRTTLTLTLNEPVASSDVVTLTYTVGTNPVQDEAGNDAAGLIDQTVRNDTPGAILTGTLTEDTLNGATVTVTLANTEYAPDAELMMDDFTLTTTDVPGVTTVSGVSRVSATEATLTLAYDGEDITVAGTLSVTVLDSGHTGSGDLTTDSVPITATALALTTPDNQRYPINRAIPALTLLEAMGATVTATYTLTGPAGESLATAVPGLSFTPADRILSGTPTVAGTTTLTYTVTDSATPPATASATFDVTIAPTLAITSPSVPEGDSGPATLTYAVTLTGATDQTVTVRYAVDASSTATVLDDYPVLPDGTLTFTSGTTTQTIEVEVTGDTDVEENETIVVLLLGATNATIVTALGTGTIIDDDGLPTISIAAMPSSVIEGTAATFTLTAAPAPATELTVMVSVTDSGDFIAGPAPTMVTIAADATTATLTVGTIDDGTDELNGVITATVEEDPDTDADYIVAASPDNRATVAVGDDDDDAVDPLVDPVITIAAGTSPVIEGTAATLTLTATPAPTADLTVMVSVTDSGNFIAGSAPTTVTIAADATTATLTMLTEDDDVNEANGMITATVGNGVGYTFVAPARADVTITDDDPLPTLAISSFSSPPSVDEGDNEAATRLLYTVTLTGAT